MNIDAGPDTFVANPGSGTKIVSLVPVPSDPNPFAERARQAKLYYDALIEEGFDDQQAMHLVGCQD